MTDTQFAFILKCHTTSNIKGRVIEKYDDNTYINFKICLLLTILCLHTKQHEQSTLQPVQKKEKLTPFLPTNQIPGEFRPMVHDEEQLVVRPHFIPSTPRPFYIQPETASYPRPSNIRVAPKSPSASQPPPASKESGETATPGNFILYQVDGIVNKPAYKPTSQHKQPKPSKETSNLQYRDQFSYTLDPNDGYDVQVPPRIVYINDRPRHPVKYYSNTPTTEATPLIASPTPFHRHSHKKQPQQQQQQYYDHHLYEQQEDVQPIAVPKEYFGSTPPSKPPSNHQHLTETTHIQSPSISIYSPRIHKPQSNPITPSVRPSQIYPKPSREQTHEYHHSSTPPTRQVDRTERPIHQTTTTESQEEHVTHPHHELQYVPQQQQHFAPKTALNEVPHYETPQPLQYKTPNVQYAALAEQPNHLSSTSLADVLQKLQKTNLLPQTLTAGNIDDSIKTLVEILNNLKNSQRVAEVPSQHVTEVPRQPYNPPQQNSGDYEEDYIDYNNEPAKDNTSGQFTKHSCLVQTDLYL